MIRHRRRDHQNQVHIQSITHHFQWWVSQVSQHAFWYNNHFIQLWQVFVCQSRIWSEGSHIQTCQWSLQPWWSFCLDQRCDFHQSLCMFQPCRIDHLIGWNQVNYYHSITLLWRKGFKALEYSCWQSMTSLEESLSLSNI